MNNPLKPIDKLFDAGVGVNPLKPQPKNFSFDPVSGKMVETVAPIKRTKEEAVGTGEKRGPYRKKVKIGVGSVFGKLIVRRKIKDNVKAIPNLRKQFRCECTAYDFEGKYCGKVIDVPQYYLLRKGNPKQDCGCQVSTLGSRYKREKQVWQMMNFRTQDPRHEAYEHYAKRGITVCEEWRRDCPDGKGFDRFFEHVGKCPTPQHSLDRVHNNKGYMPGNVKWSTAVSQRANQGDRIGGKTIAEIEAMGLTEEEWIEKVLNDDTY